jgi:hypothetical protein
MIAFVGGVPLRMVARPLPLQRLRSELQPFQEADPGP